MLTKNMFHVTLQVLLRSVVPGRHLPAWVRWRGSTSPTVHGSLRSSASPQIGQ